ncbi:hypothetical protein SAMN05444008_102202 [Cnuella takakiae]|uniref:Uncharacterized protein n=1 Tax=Cnuella takakiae TaxID=1302690 RepID=A0A1M4VAZ4_9BACT|nr:hypothetical protein [Cnuella takakiae]OLY92652.1 hypothetical protein BUE76_12705 [Cnuella takakiae]SHE66112.1 hypothetical protein SAMN05444008_102202 [Cnuella takakiae]
MKGLGLLAKLAFICNLFFLACVVMQRSAGNAQGSMVSLIAILGLVMGMGIFNPVSNIMNGLQLLRKQPITATVPLWLAITNGVFLIFQIAYLLHTLL